MAQVLPQSPFDGQEFIDAFRIKWVYNAEDGTWNKVGRVTDLPIARPSDDPLGPTNGLLAAADKAMLDAIKTKGGGFGIILKPGRYVTSDGVDNILQGDVIVQSQTLQFECLKQNPPTGEAQPINVVKISLSDDFLNSYNIELRGPTGPKGPKGPKGRDGRYGTYSDGPVGEAGKDGADATTAAALTGVIYEDLSAVYDTAVVNLRLNAEESILEVIKAKMDVPDHDKPAKRVVATQTVRDV